MRDRIAVAVEERGRYRVGAGEELIGKIAEDLGEVASKLLTGLLGLKGFRAAKDPAKKLKAAWNFLKLYDGQFCRIAGKVGADFDRGDIAHDGKRRIIQRIAVLVNLAIGVIEGFVFVLSLVFPGEVPAFPDINEAVVALGAFRCGAHDFHVFFKAVVLAGGIRLGRRRLAKDVTYVNEMLMARLAFGEMCL
ncbi:MAG TPA: hypothetical protein VFE47_22420 [Tepidisphaeraceae bacterium]|nr:hypothetical protein [Tepidisphaeraceae bacterium]